MQKVHAAIYVGTYVSKDRLQIAHPGSYPAGLIRTVQCRVKIWRGDMGRALVFGTNEKVRKPMAPDTLRDIQISRDSGHQEPPEPEFDGSENLGEQMAEATT